MNIPDDPSKPIIPEDARGNPVYEQTRQDMPLWCCGRNCGRNSRIVVLVLGLVGLGCSIYACMSVDYFSFVSVRNDTFYDEDKRQPEPFEYATNANVGLFRYEILEVFEYPWPPVDVEEERYLFDALHRQELRRLFGLASAPSDEVPVNFDSRILQETEPEEPDDGTSLNQTEAPSGLTNETDIGFDNETDIGFDNETDIGFDNETDIGFDNETDIGFDNETDIGFDNETDIGFDNETDIGFDNETDIDFGNETDAELDNETDTGIIDNNATDIDGSDETSLPPLPDDELAPPGGNETDATDNPALPPSEIPDVLPGSTAGSDFPTPAPSMLPTMTNPNDLIDVDIGVVKPYPEGIGQFDQVFTNGQRGAMLAPIFAAVGTFFGLIELCCCTYKCSWLPTAVFLYLAFMFQLMTLFLFMSEDFCKYAQECALGFAGILSVVAVVCYFFAQMLVCCTPRPPPCFNCCKKPPVKRKKKKKRDPTENDDEVRGLRDEDDDFRDEDPDAFVDPYDDQSGYLPESMNDEDEDDNDDAYTTDDRTNDHTNYEDTDDDDTPAVESMYTDGNDTYDTDHNDDSGDDDESDSRRGID